jgi:hypothetical protein
MLITNEILLQEGHNMLMRGIEFDAIRLHLSSKSSDTLQLDEVMKSLRAIYYARRRKRGVLLTLIGSVLLVFGCVFVITAYDSAAGVRLALYLPSLVGSGLVLWGIVDVLGW